MKRDFGENHYFDFAEFANIGGRDYLSDEELRGLVESCGYHPQLGEDDFLRIALMHSENMYRAATLMAYGNGLAVFEDIESFVSHRRIKSDIRSDDGKEDGIEIDVMLPYGDECFDISSGKLQVPLAYDSSLSSHAFQMPSVTVEKIGNNKAILIKAIVLPWLALLNGTERELRRKVHEKTEKERYTRKVYAFIAALDEAAYKRLEGLKGPYMLLGQLVSNMHASNAFIGVFDGKPQFRPRSFIDQLWQAMAELKDNQLPGICPICGKVIDRRRDARGGHPKNTCCSSHSDKFANERRRIRNESSEDASRDTITYREELEQIVRKERWTTPGRNERPLRFLTFDAISQ